MNLFPEETQGPGWSDLDTDQRTGRCLRLYEDLVSTNPEKQIRAAMIAIKSPEHFIEGCKQFKQPISNPMRVALECVDKALHDPKHRGACEFQLGFALRELAENFDLKWSEAARNVFGDSLKLFLCRDELQADFDDSDRLIAQTTLNQLVDLAKTRDGATKQEICLAIVRALHLEGAIRNEVLPEIEVEADFPAPNTETFPVPFERNFEQRALPAAFAKDGAHALIKLAIVMLPSPQAAIEALCIPGETAGERRQLHPLAAEMLRHDNFDDLLAIWCGMEVNIVEQDDSPERFVADTATAILHERDIPGDWHTFSKSLSDGQGSVCRNWQARDYFSLICPFTSMEAKIIWAPLMKAWVKGYFDVAHEKRLRGLFDDNLFKQRMYQDPKFARFIVSVIEPLCESPAYALSAFPNEIVFKFGSDDQKRDQLADFFSQRTVHKKYADIEFCPWQRNIMAQLLAKEFPREFLHHTMNAVASVVQRPSAAARFVGAFFGIKPQTPESSTELDPLHATRAFAIQYIAGKETEVPRQFSRTLLKCGVPEIELMYVLCRLDAIHSLAKLSRDERAALTRRLNPEEVKSMSPQSLKALGKLNFAWAELYASSKSSPDFEKIAEEIFRNADIYVTCFLANQRHFVGAPIAMRHMRRHIVAENVPDYGVELMSIVVDGWEKYRGSLPEALDMDVIRMRLDRLRREIKRREATEDKDS